MWGPQEIAFRLLSFGFLREDVQKQKEILLDGSNLASRIALVFLSFDWPLTHARCSTIFPNGKNTIYPLLSTKKPQCLCNPLIRVVI